MNKKWSYFLAASVLGGFALVTHGAPLAAVLAGIGGAALVMRLKSRTV
jgi:hypothetical protein